MQGNIGLEEFLKTVKKGRGAAYEWQDDGARLAKNLGFKPGKSWFKFFRENFDKHKGLIHSTYSQIKDISMKKPELYFYKVYYKNLRKKD